MFWVEVYKDRDTEENIQFPQITEYHMWSETGSFYGVNFNIKKQEGWHKAINNLPGCQGWEVSSSDEYAVLRAPGRLVSTR